MKPASKMAEMGRTWGPVDITEPLSQLQSPPYLWIQNRPTAQLRGGGHSHTAGQVNSGVMQLCGATMSFPTAGLSELEFVTCS